MKGVVRIGELMKVREGCVNSKAKIARIGRKVKEVVGGKTIDGLKENR